MVSKEWSISVGLGLAVGLSTTLLMAWFRDPRTSSIPGISMDEITLKDPQQFYTLTLMEKEVINHDCRRLRFALPSANHVLGIPVGQHVHVSAIIDGEKTTRSYSPVSRNKERGYVDLIIKIYFKDVHPNFPHGGKMTQYLESLTIGDTLDFRGPSGRLVYLGSGLISIKSSEVRVKSLNMIAGGVGITPMIQLLRHICKDNESTEVALLYANQAEDDILLRTEIEEIARLHSTTFKVWYTLDRPPDGWMYSSGFISAEMIQKHMYPPSSDTFVLMCGPPPMIKYACIPNLNELNYDKNLRFVY